MPYTDVEKERAAWRRYYRRKKDAGLWIPPAQVARERNQRFISEVKSVPCMDCGMKYPPYVMDFDHRGDKLSNISALVSRGVSLVRLKAEIAKCEIVCANCHRVRTHSRNHGE